MKISILIISSLFLLACGAQKNTKSVEASALSKKASEVKEMYGKVVIKSKLSADGNSEVPVLYFDNGTAFLINLSESKVSKTELENRIDEKIGILGEIKFGETPKANQYLGKAGQSIEEGRYVIIYKVL